MRLWTLHPRHLDAQGLVALWREALLAQKVLQGRTKGYRHHPQLRRFLATTEPVAAVASYLNGVHAESVRRGYHFDATKIAPERFQGSLAETKGQLRYEWDHLKRKLKLRDPVKFTRARSTVVPAHHPLFHLIRGEVREWENVTTEK